MKCISLFYSGFEFKSSLLHRLKKNTGLTPAVYRKNTKKIINRKKSPTVSRRTTGVFLYAIILIKDLPVKLQGSYNIIHCPMGGSNFVRTEALIAVIKTELL